MSHHSLENDPFTNYSAPGEGQGMHNPQFSQELECKVVSKEDIKAAEAEIKKAEKDSEEADKEGVKAAADKLAEQSNLDTKTASKEDVKKAEAAKKEETK